MIKLIQAMSAMVKKVNTASLLDIAGLLLLFEYDIPVDLFDACRDAGGIPIGVVPIDPKLNVYGAIAYWCPTYLMNPHVLIVASTGGGKTTLLRTMMARFAMMKGITNVSIIVLDARREFTLLPEVLGVGKVYRIGDDYVINPFLGLGIREDEIIDNFIHLLLALRLVEPHAHRQISLMTEALHELLHPYTPLTREELYSLEPRLPMMHQFISLLEEKISRLDNVEDRRSMRAVLRKMAVLRHVSERNRIGVNILNPMRLIHEPGIHVLDLSPLPERAKKFFMHYITYVVYLAMRAGMITPTYGLDVNVLLVIDEAHHVLDALRDPHEAEAHPIMKILREGRHFGVGVWFSTQNISDAPPHIMNLIGTFFLGKLSVSSRELREYLDPGIVELIKDLEPHKFVVRVVATDPFATEGRSRVISGDRIFILRTLPWFPKKGSLMSMLISTENMAEAIAKSLLRS